MRPHGSPDLFSQRARNLNECFERNEEVAGIRMGKKQEIETLVSEEALLFAMYLRDEKKEWIPRIVMSL